MAEILVIGNSNEDKKLRVQFLDSEAAVIPLADLLGYGLIIYGPDQGIIGKFGKDIDGFEVAKVSEVDATTIELVLEGVLIPNKVGEIIARSVVKFTDLDFEAGYRVDYSKTQQTLYNIERV